ncbi:hypothetical protein Prum_019320 [Phytohabitans rumicis]|uniref:Uncharacterized protein n=1 Tax=Phytohabitans rumicis TaxID=1076125 RepID=A0A6V8KY23_9ACTN|nr:hypothetical protein Prum_019320 [Phytohabitans rumicis]
MVTRVDQLGDRVARALLGHQTLAHQDRVGTRRGVPDEVVRTPHARLGDLDDVVRQSGRDPLEHRPVHLQRPQVAGVDPDDLRTRLQGPVGLFLGVHLDQRGHAQRLDPLQQTHQHLLLQRRHDQQHQVGPVRPGLVHLVAGDHEVLAQDWHLHGGPHRHQVVQGPAEPPALGQHADAPGTARGVLRGQVSRVRDLGELPLGRGRPLDLRDHPDARLAQRRVRVERGRGGRREFLDPFQRDPLLSQLDVLAHAGEDLVEHTHGCPGGGPAAVVLRVRMLSSHQRTPLSGCHSPDARGRHGGVGVRGMARLTGWTRA